MITEVYFPPELIPVILADWRNLIRDGFRQVHYTPQLNFFLHLIGFFDQYNPKGIEVIWSFHFDESLRQTMTFWDDLLAFKRPVSFHYPGTDELLRAMQAELADILGELKVEAREILEEEAWSVAKDRWDEARGALLDDQPQLTRAQQHDHLPDFGDLVDGDAVDTVLTERIRFRLEKAANSQKLSVETMTIAQPRQVTQPVLWQTVQVGLNKPGSSQASSQPMVCQSGKPAERQTDSLHRRTKLPNGERKRRQHDNPT